MADGATPAPAATAGAPASGGRPHTGMILGLACLAQFMVVLDVTIVNVALPSIRSSLGFSADGLQWVVNGYVLTFAGFLMLGGRAGDIFGRRRVFLAGLVVFTVASLVGGFAQDPAWLTAARAAQGIGGALLSPATLTIIMTTFDEGATRTKAIGTWSAVGGSGGAAGSILGGVLVSGFGWRSVLFVNLPIGVVGFVLARRYLLADRATSRGRLDVGGAVTVTAGLALLVYAIVGTDKHPWTSATTLLTLAAAVVALAAFVVIQTRSRSPLVPLRLFRSRAVTGANVTMLMVGAVFFSFWYFLSLYLQSGLGYDALKAGLAFAPMGAFIIVGAKLSPPLVVRAGFRPVILLGLAVTAAGLGWTEGFSAHSGYVADILGPGSLVSLGFGIAMTPLAGSATAGVPGREAGLASGLLNTSRQIGGSVGLAVLATVATSRSAGLLRVGHSAASALTAGTTRAYLVGVGLLAVGAAATVILPSRPRPALAAGLALAD